jgi:NADH-ubiquinone oxidoreductase chain 5
MVTAGVFLIIRCSAIYENSYLALFLITFIGWLTALFSAVTGVLQNDLKKVIAYSTCSQLGYMVFACGLSNYNISMFHLMNHAYFKALLFLTAGAIIHALADEQDMRKMGGLLQVLPFCYSMMLIGSLALMGFPFLTGFYSKDVILEIAYANYNFSGIFTFWLGLASAGLTSFYSFRLIYLTFIGNPNGLKIFMQNARDAPYILGFPLLLLSFFSIFFGFASKDLFIGLGTPYWNNSIYTLPAHLVIIDAEFSSIFMKWLPVIVSISNAVIAFSLYFYGANFLYKIYQKSVGHTYYVAINRKLLFDKLQNELIAVNLLQVSYSITYKLIDKGLIELIGPNGFVKTTMLVGKTSANLQSGLLNHYSFLMFVAVICFISLIMLFVVLKIYVGTHIYFLLLFTWIFIITNN